MSDGTYYRSTYVRASGVAQRAGMCLLNSQKAYRYTLIEQSFDYIYEVRPVTGPI